MDIQTMTLATVRSREARHYSMAAEWPCFVGLQGQVVECTPTAIAGVASIGRRSYPRRANFGMEEVMAPLEESWGKHFLLARLRPRADTFARRMR
jgi:hypothetical protein